MCVSKGRHQLVYEDASSYSINPFALFSDIKTGARNKGNCSLSTACVSFSQLKVSYYLYQVFFIACKTAFPLWAEAVNL